MRRPRSLLVLLAASVFALLTSYLLLTSSTVGAISDVRANSGNLLANPGFETGTLSGWNCSAADSVVASPVHSGSHALRGAAGSTDAQCSQMVSVRPDSSYTLTGWVQGSYVFIGDSGTGATDTSMWTASATWKQLSTSFRTGASATSVTIYVHGWYAQGTFYADDLSLTGTRGSAGQSLAPSVVHATIAPSGRRGGGHRRRGGGHKRGGGGHKRGGGGHKRGGSGHKRGGGGHRSGGGGAGNSGGGGGGGGGGNFAVAPYTDMTNAQEPMLNRAATQAGLKAFTAAFVIGSGCTPIWGDTLPVTNDPTVTSEIHTAKADGAQPIISFGGEGGVELAESCTNRGQLTAAYQSVINTLHVTHIDFDIEGAAIAETATNNLRFQAIKALEAANPGLVVSVTIPVNPTGPDNNGQAFLQAAKANGTRIDVINIMTMDYGGSFDAGGANMGAFAVEAAKDTLAFAKTLWPGMTFANIGDTPMIGQNDDSAEVFTEADASTLVSFAQQNHLGRLSFWSVDRDQPCGGSASGLPSCSEVSQQRLDFIRIFARY